MNLDLISGTDADLPAGRTKAECLSDSLEIVERCLTETRTISHLMHPPLLDEVGLGSALNWYVEGFVKRSGIKANLLLPPRVPRLGNEAEIALFRCVQEGLTNAHRHASCSSVEITLSVDADYVALTVRDNGQGIPEGRLASIQDSSAQGIGLAGIRERVRDLGGTFDLSSDSSGTVMTVLIPARVAVSRTSLSA
jgi:signal transduction histidine kinase